MQIIVNGTAHNTAAGTLAALVEELGHDAGVVATALNGEFAPRSDRAGTSLAEGDRVEILAPMQGG
ncbi:MAG: sulfur carrier protein ThiS [Pseudomonadota bacterium]